MSRRSKVAFRLALSAAGFLCLTMAAGFGLRAWLEGPDHARGPASMEARSVFEHRGNLSASELAMLGSEPLKRGRRVEFHDAVFREHVLGETNQVALNLFPDLTLTGAFQKPSSFKVNEDLFVGTVLGDPDSSIRMQIQNGIVDGVIQYRGVEFRIIDGANGQVIITESKAKAP